MNITTGLNMKLPDGRQGHYVRAQRYENNKITVRFFSIAKLGEEKALKSAMDWTKKIMTDRECDELYEKIRNS